MDATLVTAHSDKEGAAPTWKKGYGFHPLAAWAANTRECLAMLQANDLSAGQEKPSYAAYRLLRWRYRISPNAGPSLARYA